MTIARGGIGIERVEPERDLLHGDLRENAALQVAPGVDGTRALADEAHAQPLDGRPGKLAPRVVVPVALLTPVVHVLGLDVGVERAPRDAGLDAGNHAARRAEQRADNRRHFERDRVAAGKFPADERGARRCAPRSCSAPRSATVHGRSSRRPRRNPARRAWRSNTPWRRSSSPGPLARPRPRRRVRTPPARSC